jgi:hypothetical protein
MTALATTEVRVFVAKDGIDFGSFDDYTTTVNMAPEAYESYIRLLGLVTEYQEHEGKVSPFFHWIEADENILEGTYLDGGMEAGKDYNIIGIAMQPDVFNAHVGSTWMGDIQA